jgi:hypothetical protein
VLLWKFLRSCVFFLVIYLVSILLVSVLRSRVTLVVVDLVLFSVSSCVCFWGGVVGGGIMFLLGCGILFL